VKKIFLAKLFLVMCSTNLNAATVICSGTVEELAYHAPNSFMVRLSSMNKPVFFCNPDKEFSVSGTSYVTGPESCKVLYSTFLSAKVAQKTINSMYFDGDQVPASCNDWGDWKSANIRYFTFKN